MSNRSCFGGIDLANNHVIIPAVNSNGKVILHKFATCPNLLTNLTNMPSMRMGLEAFGGVHCGG